MKTTPVHDSQGWFKGVTIGGSGRDPLTISVDPSGDGSVDLSVGTGDRWLDSNLTPAELDDLIRGLLTARTAIKVDRRRMAERMAQIAAAADERAAALGRTS